MSLEDVERDEVGEEVRAWKRRRPGQIVGNRVLVRTSDRLQSLWVALCLVCGRKAVCHPVVFERTACRCTKVQPRLCVSCGTTEPARFARRLASWCLACDRAKHRNGLCACGRARRFQMCGHTPVPCACGA